MKPALALAACALALSLRGGPARAGDYHREADLDCADCHTAHYVQSDEVAGWEPGGPFSSLLVASSANVLCLFCHDGSDPAAPDVLDPVGMYAGSGSETSGAGYFGAPPGESSPRGHDLGVPATVPLRADGRVMTLTCASCHAVHANEFYRNLRAAPDSLGQPAELRVGAELFLDARPAVPPERAATIAAYRSGNTGYRESMDDWCVRCHDLALSGVPGEPPAHHRIHPGGGAALGTPGAHTDPAHWQGGTGEGFGAATGDGAAGVPRVRVQTPGAASGAQARAPGPGNEVFCGSCHLAHGAGSRHALVWPYREGGADARSACEQCHRP